jgi:hypothetical protein
MSTQEQRDIWKKANKKYKNTEKGRISAKNAEARRHGLRKEAVKRYYCTLKGRAYSLRRGALTRARKLNLPFDLTKEWVLERLERGFCEVTGLPFTFVTEETYGKQNNQHPWSPSIDRIVPSKGYTMENSRVVCLMFNVCKHHWTDADVLTFVQSFSKEN